MISSAKKKNLPRKPSSKKFHPDSANFNPELLKNILRYIGDEILVIDEEGRILYANDAALEGLGSSMGDLVGSSLTRFFNKKISLAQWKKTHLAELKKSRKPVSYQFERKSKGQVRLVDVTAVYASFDGKGYILSVARDVTRQASLQEGLKESKNLYRLLSEGAADGIITLDLTGKITYINPAMAGLLEIPSRVQEPRLYTDFLSPQDVIRARKIFQGLRSGKSFSNQTVNIITQTGMTIPVELNVSPLYQGNQVIGAHSIVRDLRPRIEKDRLQRETEKMEALKYFIGGAAHELKNPLLGIFRIAEGILTKYKDRDFEYISHHDFSIIFSNIERMRNQIQYCYETADRLLQLSRKKAHLGHASADPRAVIKDILAEKAAVLKHNEIRVRVSFSKAMAKVRMGPVDLSQVVGNILDNAIQAMDSSGTLTVSAKLSSDRKTCVIQVRDQGIGISQEDLPHIFEPFFTTKFLGAYKNSGLGLSIAYALIKSVQGGIEVKSDQRKGTLIRIILPVAKNRS